MIEVNESIRNTLATLPKKPGCYLMKDADDKIIYVGKAINLRNRVTTMPDIRKRPVSWSNTLIISNGLWWNRSWRLSSLR